MARVTKEFKFEAAHQLPGHKGKCADLHGHSYVVELGFEGPIIRSNGASEDGFVIDFSDVSGMMKPLIEQYLDHKFLNDSIPELSRTSAELLACWIFGRIYHALDQLRRQNPLYGGVKLVDVCLWETATSTATITQSDWITAGSPAGVWK
jgi:6-pyruvoyltetrahydropterin/6-carboxytetrahydropterin synthase